MSTRDKLIKARLGVLALTEELQKQRYQRLFWLERKVAATDGVLTDAQRRLLRRRQGRQTNPEQHIEAPHPDHQLCQ